MKIVMVGNSHLPAFQRGWTVLAPHCPHISITFYPYFRQFYHMFAVDEVQGRIVMTNPMARYNFIKLNGGDGSFRPLDFDLCIIVGGAWLWHGLKPGLYSQAMQDAVVLDYVNAMHPMVLLNKIRLISDIPVMIVMNPFEAARDGDNGDVITEHNNGVELVNAVLRPRYEAIMLSQPAETLHSPRQTKLEYATDEQVRHLWPGAQSPAFWFDDMCHMNAAFGTIYLRDILRSLGQTLDDIVIPPAEGHLRMIDKTQRD